MLHQILMSDSEGVVVMQKNDFAREDTLMFRSMFYEPLRIAAGALMETN